MPCILSALRLVFVWAVSLALLSRSIYGGTPEHYSCSRCRRRRRRSWFRCRRMPRAQHRAFVPVGVFCIGTPLNHLGTPLNHL